MATTAGEFLQAPDEAEALIASTDQAAADVLAELPGLEGKTYAMANYVPGDQMYVVADPDDGAATLFAQLGMEIDPDLVAIADGASGRVELSLERIGELDADLLLLLTNGADPAEIPGYSALPAVQSGAVVDPRPRRRHGHQHADAAVGPVGPRPAAAGPAGRRGLSGRATSTSDRRTSPA